MSDWIHLAHDYPISSVFVLVAVVWVIERIGENAAYIVRAWRRLK